MKTSCISHPSNEPLILIRKWQIEACSGNQCAAALLSFLEYWHNIKVESSQKARTANEVAEKHGDEPTQDDSLWQFHTAEELEQGIMVYRKDSIRDAIKLLESKGFIQTGRNPNPRYRFDNTKFFLLDVDTVQRFLADRPTENRISYTKNQRRPAENPRRDTKNQRPSLENRTTIPKTSSETTNKITNREPQSSITLSRDLISRADFSNDISNLLKRSLTEAEEKILLARSKEKFDAHRIMLAIRAYASSKYQRSKYGESLDLTIICATASKVDHLITMQLESMGRTTWDCSECLMRLELTHGNCVHCGYDWATGFHQSWSMAVAS